MTDGVPEDVGEAFDGHDGYERAETGFAVVTTPFEGRVMARPHEEADWKDRYTVVVYAPTLETATADEVGEAVAGSWLETLERRLEEAPKATRASVDLAGFTVEEVGPEVRIEYEFSWGNPGRAADIAKTFVEYVEGTYVEGVVPGYEYEGAVAALLSSASQSGNQGTPL